VFRPPHRNTSSLTLTLLCIAGLVVIAIATAALSLDYAQRTRGIAFGFPEPIEPYLPSRPALGANVSLERYDDEALSDNLARIESAGFTWLRQTFAWAQIESQPGAYDWAASDRILDAIAGTSLRTIATLDTSPVWATPTSSLQPPASNLQHPPSSLRDFARFARAFAERYGRRVDYYQIWDEPNLGARWNGEVNPVAYAEMLRQARDAIREVDPNSVILLAGLAPTVEQSSANMADWLFLRRLYEAGAKDVFDVVSGKPYGFDTGPDDRRIDPSVLNFSHIVLMRDEMVSHGDAGKPLWASHFGWNTHPQSIWGHATSEQQALWTRQAIRRARDEWPWLGVMVVENWQPALTADDARWGFALLDASGLPTPALDAVEDSASRQASAGLGYHPSALPIRPGSGDYIANGLASFEGDWRFGELGADWSTTGERVTFSFTGTSVALRVRRAADRANLYVTLDGQPANALPWDDRGAYLQLIPPVKTVIEVTTIPIAAGLSDGAHTVEIVTERGWNQWSLVGWSVGRQEDHAGLDAALIGLGIFGFALAAGAIRHARRVSWGMLGLSLSTLYSRLGNASHIAMTALAALVFYASAWLTWGVDVAAAYRRLGDPANLLITLAAVTIFGLSPWLILTILSGIALFVLVLLRIDLGLMLVAFFAPFYLLPANLFYRFSSMVEMTLAMCVIAWGARRLHAWRTRTSRARFLVSRDTWRLACGASLDWAVLALLGVSTLSMFASQYFEFALREWRIILLEPVIFYVLLRSCKLDRAAVWRIVDALVLAGVVVAVVGLVQYAFNLNIITAEEGTRRLRSVYGSPNNAGLFLGRVLPIALAFAALGRGRRRWLSALCLLPIGAAIVLSQSRGAIFIGAPAAILAVGVLAGGRWLWAAIGALLVGAVAAIPFLNSPRMQALLSGEGTQVFRVALWRSSLDMIREQPILGVGPDSFLYAYRGRYLLPEAWQESSLSHPHNVVLDFAARLGLLGLGVFIWIQVAFWKAGLGLARPASATAAQPALGDAATQDRALAIGLMASMVDFLAHGMVDAAYFVVDLAFVFMLTLALVQKMRDR